MAAPHDSTAGHAATGGVILAVVAASMIGFAIGKWGPAAGIVLGLVTFLSWILGVWAFVMRKFLGFDEQ